MSVLVLGRHLAPDVMEHPLLHAHHVLVVHPRAFDVEGDELIQVAVGIVLLGSECRADLEDTLEPTEDSQLLVQLRAL